MTDPNIENLEVDYGVLVDAVVAGDEVLEDILIDAALLEDPDAQWALAWVHIFRNLESTEQEAAAAWFRKAASYGHERAQAGLLGLLMSKAGLGDLAALEEAQELLATCRIEGNRIVEDTLKRLEETTGFDLSLLEGDAKPRMN